MTTSAILLRKLTEKSTLNFGKHYNVTVQHLLEIDDKKYLRWVYFNCSNITFTDEILDKINITQEFRFQKPNTNKELFEVFNNLIINSWSEQIKEKALKNYYKRQKAIQVRNSKTNSYLFLRSSLVRKNHGH